MSRPSVPTVKRLFNQSGQLCNYTTCDQPIVDDAGVIMVDICHIAAASEEGPRYDANQTDGERHDFDNLVLICPNHHRLVDSQPETYSVESLQRMKAQASSTGVGVSLTDETVEALIAALMGAGAAATVVSVGQIGGQIAQTIVNVGDPAREVSDGIKARMMGRLESLAGTSIAFASFAGDPEAAGYKRLLMEIFDSAGWIVADQSTFMFFGDKAGIVMTIPFDADEAAPQIQAAISALDETGQLLEGNRGDMANDAGMYVQVWPAPSR